MKKRYRGKHFEEKTKSSNKTIFFLLIIVVIVLLIENKSVVKHFCEDLFENVGAIYEEIITKINLSLEEGDNIEIPDKIGDYDVLGILVIDKIGIQKNILNKTTDEALNISITKFYGPQINEEGNFCITGHNYKGTFAELSKLEINDTFYIIDKANSEKVTYKIYDRYTVNPDELNCLSQETNGKREVTLITCNPRRSDKTNFKSKRDLNLKI